MTVIQLVLTNRLRILSQFWILSVRNTSPELSSFGSHIKPVYLVYKKRTAEVVRRKTL